MTTHVVWLALFGTAMAFGIPGPCSYDAHPELDCVAGARCPDELVCAADGFCKPADVACDDLDEDDFPGGGVACDGVCVGSATFLTDASNCGACGKACAEGLGCCGGECVALDVDARCGACEVACDADEICLDGTCSPGCSDDTDCASAEVCCDRQCRDATLDERCGACDVACAAPEEACVAQECRDTCSDDGDCPGSRCCGGLCVLEGDPAHCGACDSPCGADTVCLDDTCAPECAVDRPCGGIGEDCCGGRCLDTSADDENCGACDAPCVGATFCNGGACHDGTERDCCGPSCTDCFDQSRTCEAGQCVRCDFLEQDCGPTSFGGTATCSPSLGVAPPEGVCVNALPAPAPGRNQQCTRTTGSADCLAGFDCQAINADIDGCVAYCDPLAGGNGGCLVDELCLPVEVVPGAFIGICALRCTLTSFSCTYDGLVGTCAPDGVGLCGDLDGVCLPPGSALEGQVCARGADCAVGMTCDAFDGTCRRLCENAGTACSGGGTCATLLGCSEIGVCR